ncbi:MAG: hypothetical protein M1821_007483 [Bathelium mastoideum]|nr:MAG: hypothetical protein M1821_007483 [Bathelium mastoideum]
MAETPSLAMDKLKGDASEGIFADVAHPNCITPSQFVELSQSKRVTIVVGDDPTDGKTYQIPRGLLVRQSRFFHDILKDSNSDGDFEITVELPEISAPAFDSFLQWLFTGTCELDDVYDAVGAWYVGHQLGAHGLKNCAMECLHLHFMPDGYPARQGIDAGLVLAAYQLSPKGSKLRKFFAWVVYWLLTRRWMSLWGWVEGLQEQAPHFYEDMVNLIDAVEHTYEPPFEPWGSLVEYYEVTGETVMEPVFWRSSS